MKSLTQYILEAQSKPTVEWMKEYYEKFNKELFDNQLPSNIRLGLISNTKEKALGWQGFNHAYYYSKDYMRGDMYIMLYFDKTISYTFNGHRQTVDVSKAKHATSAEELSPFIELNPRYQFSDFQKEDTLIHEMIHLWVHRNGLGPKRAHGKEFKAKPMGSRELKQAYRNNLDQIIGKMATVKFFYYSDDGTPLQPVLKAIRDYE